MAKKDRGRGRAARRERPDEAETDAKAGATEAAREACRRQGATGVSAVVVARAITAGALLATLAKAERERVRVQLSGRKSQPSPVPTYSMRTVFVTTYDSPVRVPW